MKQLLSALFFSTLLAVSCKQEEKREYPLTTDRTAMPRQTIPAWPAGSVKDTCVEITEADQKLISGSVTVKQEPLGTYFSFSSGRGRHNVYDSMGFEMDRLEDGGKHYAYTYLYDAERRFLYKIGQRTRQGTTYYDTSITVYIGNQSFSASQSDNGVLTIIASTYNDKGQLVYESNEFCYPNMMRAPAANRQHYANKLFYTGDKLDSLVTTFVANKPPFRKLKLVFDAAGLPAQALVENEVVYSMFLVSKCANSDAVKPH